jgi:putative addiction module killer protein
MIELREYVDAQGLNPYRRWASKQDPSIRVRVDKAVFRLGEGNFSSAKPEGQGVSALRLDYGPGYRVYFARDGEQLVLLLVGGTKRRQQRGH